MAISLSEKKIKEFQDLILNYYKKHGRKDLPFRLNHDPYAVLVSEIMLQQTQVERGIQKYNEFLEAFPNFQSLAKAPQKRLLEVWSGLGYNRRALSLQKCAQEVVNVYEGELPNDFELLVSLPGIGPYTASAIQAFAFDSPVELIETNVRTVYIHHFLNNRDDVHDNEIMELVSKTNYTKSPRIWYYALMDYGVKLKKDLPNPSRKSRHHSKQSTFKGSNREARGKILKSLLKESKTKQLLLKDIELEKERVEQSLEQLIKEGFIKKDKRKFVIM